MKILGTGLALGETSLTNEALAAIFPPERIRQKTGIQARRRSGRSTAALATAALAEALTEARLDGRNLQGLILSTNSGDHWVPPTVADVAREIGCLAPAFDLNAGCTGSLFALRLTTAFRGPVAVVASETVSRFCSGEAGDWCSVIFGDGAAAVILEAPLQPLGAAWGSEPDGRNWMVVENGRGRLEGRPLFDAAVKLSTGALTEACTHAGVPVASLDRIVPHQANLRVLEAVSRELGYPLDRMVQTIQWTGNLSSASLLVALVHGIRRDLLLDKQVVGLVAFGAGLTWGALVCQLRIPFRQRRIEEEEP